MSLHAAIPFHREGEPLVFAVRVQALLELVGRLTELEGASQAAGGGVVPEVRAAAERLLGSLAGLPATELPLERLADLGRFVEGEAGAPWETGVTGLTGFVRQFLGDKGYRLETEPSSGLRRLVSGGGKGRVFRVPDSPPATGGLRLEPPPEPERLPHLRAHLEGRLRASGSVLENLAKLLTWDKTQEKAAPRHTRRTLQRIEEARSRHATLSRRLEALGRANAVALSRAVLPLYPDVVQLQAEVSQDPLLNRVLQSELINTRWAEADLVRPEDDETLAAIEGLPAFLQGVDPDRRGAIESLLVQYFQYLRTKRGGALGPFPKEPFDRQVFAVVLAKQRVGPLSSAFVPDALRFFGERWGLVVPSLEEMASAVFETEQVAVKLLEARRLAVPGRFRIVEPGPDESAEEYLASFGAPEDVLPGGEEARPAGWARRGDIGWLIYRWRYILEDARRLEALYEGHEPAIPDLVGAVRRRYGDEADLLFGPVDASDPHTVRVEIPPVLEGFSWSGLFHANVYASLRAAVGTSLRAARDTAGKRLAEEEPVITPRTLRTHERALVLAHRRTPKSRRLERELMGLYGGSAAFDLFLEMKPAIDLAAEVVLPDGRVRTPPAGVLSRTRFRLVGATPAASTFAADRPQIDASIFPYKYLRGERGPFSRLLGEVSVRIGAREALTGEDVTEVRTLAQQLTERHSRMVANLRVYMGNPAATPFDTAAKYQRFYRRVLLLASQVFGIPIEGRISHAGREVSYRLVPPYAATNYLSLVRTGGGAWQADLVPDAIVSVVRGEQQPLSRVADLLNLKLAFAVSQQGGAVTALDLPSILERLFADRTPEERGILARMFRAVGQIESATFEPSGLGPENPDVAEVFQWLERRSRAPRGGLVPRRWLSEQLADYLWYLHGIPSVESGPALNALGRYFELNPRWNEAFDAGLWDQAIRETGAEGLRDDLLGFLYSIGGMVGEGFRPPVPHVRVGALGGPRSPSGGLPPRDGASGPGAVPPNVASQLPDGLVVEPVLGRFVALESEQVRGGQIEASELAGIVAGLVERFRDRVLEGRHPARVNLAQAAQELIGERDRALQRETSAGQRGLLIDEAGQVLERLGHFLAQVIGGSPFPKDGLARTVAHGLVREAILGTEGVSLPHLAARILISKKVPVPGPAYSRTVGLASDWFLERQRSVTEDDRNLDAIVDLVMEERPGDRAGLVASVLRQGKELLASVFSGVNSLDDWEGLLRRHERTLLLFAPGLVRRLTARWEGVLASYPAPAAPAGPTPAGPRPPPPPPAAGPGRPPRAPQGPLAGLAPRVWDPVRLTFMTPEEHRPFVDKILRASPPGEQTHLIFFWKGDRLDVARLDDADRAGILPVLEHAGPVEDEPDVLEFVDRTTGETVRVSSTMAMYQMSFTSPPRRSLLSFLGEIGPDHPLYGDIMALEALFFHLILPSDVVHERNRIIDSVSEGRLPLTPKGLRDTLNAFLKRHHAEISQAVNYRRVMGPWAVSKKVEGYVRRRFAGDSWAVDRLSLVLDMLGLGIYPPEIVGPLRAALRDFETRESRTEEDYRGLVDTILGLWPLAMTRVQETVRAGFAHEPDLAPIADARELMIFHSGDRNWLVGQAVERRRRAKREKEMGQLRYWTAVENVARDPALPVVRQVLVLGAQRGKILDVIQHRELSGIVERAVRPLRSDRERGEMTRAVVRFYLRERGRILDRLWSERGSPGRQWVHDVVEPRPEREVPYADRFPELREITLRDIDDFTAEQELLPRVREGLILEVRQRGLARLAFVNLLDLLWHKAGAGGLNPIGIREQINGSWIYFPRLSGVIRPPTITVEDFRAGGDVRVVMEDRTSRTIPFRGNEVAQVIDPKADLTPIARRDARFLHRVLMEPEMRDVAPMLVVLYGTSREQVLHPEITSRIDAMVTVGTEGSSWMEEVRRRILDLYAVARTHFSEMGLDPRFIKEP